MTVLLSGCTSQSRSVVLSSANEESLTQTTADEQISGDKEESLNEGDFKEPVISEQEPQIIAVYVCGAVNNPGVYELLEGSRICDALESAGGFSDEADSNYVNLAAKLTDGMKLQIPTTSEISENSKLSAVESFDGETLSGGDTASEKKLVNINTASKEELKTLPGIGDGIAGKIIQYREERGSFKSTEDIMKVSGIKEKLFSKIRDYITV